MRTLWLHSRTTEKVLIYIRIWKWQCAEYSQKSTFFFLFRFTVGDLWNTFFDKILNPNGKSTVPLLQDLREELSSSFDGSFPGHLCDFILSWKTSLMLETWFWHRESAPLNISLPFSSPLYHLRQMKAYAWSCSR